MKKLLHKMKLLVLLPLLMISLVPASALADNAKSQIICGVNSAAGNSCTANPPDKSSLDSEIKTIINLLSLVVGILATIMIIVAGLRYITSGGDPEKVKSAKNTLMYVVVGLVIVALAQTISHFVLTEAANPSTASPKK